MELVAPLLKRLVRRVEVAEVNWNLTEDRSLPGAIRDLKSLRSPAIDSGLNDLGVVHPFPFLPSRRILITPVFPRG